MTPLAQSRNLAARMGRWSASHWKTAVFGWLAFVIAAFAIGSAVGTKTIDETDQNVGEARRGDHILQDAGYPQSSPITEIVIVQSTTKTIDVAGFRAAVDDVVDAVDGLPTIKNVRSPLQAENDAQVSKDRRTALVEWDMKGTQDVAEKNVDKIVAATDKVAKAHPDLYIGQAGSASSNKALNAMFADSLKDAGTRSIPLTLAILLIVFGSLLAAGVPLLLALTAVAAAIGLNALPSHFIPTSEDVAAVILLVGLAVGVDYVLFYLTRYREERANGRSEQAALEAAAATSGRSVLISGVTVMIAMAGMLFSGDKTFMSFSIATMLVVAIAMLGSLTVLPALLSRLGDGIERGRIPYLRRRRRNPGGSRVWARILSPALRHPVIAAVGSAAVLLVMAVPVLHLHTAQSGFEALSKNAPTVETLTKIQDSFEGEASPASVAVRTDTDSVAFKNAANELKARVVESSRMHGPVNVEINPAHTVARIDIPLNGSGVDDESNAALKELREQILPPTVGQLDRAEYAVTGGTAASADFNSAMKKSVPIVFGFVLTFAFLLLLVTFRSVVVAAKAIVLNLLSVAAAYGAVVAIFQYGWGENLLNFNSNGGIANWLPMFMFVILFGLSMDYHVFILSRVREAYDRGMSTDDAVEHGIKSTAGVVTSAAIVMVGAFLIFATLPFLDFKEIGIGLAVAVLLDATIVRAFLLPATMKLLGDWNWYLPKWLEWLPQINHETEAPTAPPESAPVYA